MSKNRRITVFILTSAIGLIIFIGSVQSGQNYSDNKESDFILPKGIGIVQQAKSKYLYVGSERCATKCHNNEKMGFQYNIFLASTHAKAYEDLASKKADRYARIAHVKENPQESTICLKCHITGAGLDSSFFAVTYKKEDGVTCEACHRKAHNPKDYLPKETDCMECHNSSVHKTRKFHFNDRFKTIAHSRPEAGKE